ncbi:hypothetical protein OS347_000759 [Vibrio vulnificus]|nr:hypothetical protein [Vibrio vulnificus]
MIVVNVTKEIPVNVNSLQVKIKKELPLNGNVELIKSKSNSVEFENTEHVVKVVTGAGIYDAQVNADKLEVTKLTKEVREAHTHIHADKSSVEQSESNALLYAQAADEAATDSERSSASSHQFAQESLASKNAAKTSETNSKASETKAKASETNAAASASTASTKASEASTSASKALASQNAAKTSETNAAASASTASTKATLATQQATIATTKASESSSSAAAAKTSETNSKASETKALASQNAAKTSETNSKASETKALASQNASASSAAAAKTSETNSKASETTANASKNAAKTSETNAAASASTASTKADEALSSANAAKASQNAAKTSETNSKASETASASSKNSAAASASTASTKASEALSSANAAKASETKSKTSETNAKASELKAAEYAATLAGGLNDGGNIDLSSGVYPAVPALPTFWKVTKGGTVSGIEYGVGDTLIYSKVSGFYKIDNTESVTSVNGFKGAVNLNAAHVGAYPSTGGSVSGNIQANGGSITVMSPNSATSNAHFWLKRSDGTNAGLLYWERGSQNIHLRRYSTSNALESEIVLQNDRIHTNKFYTQDAAQSSLANALTRKDYVDGTFVKKAGDTMTGDLTVPNLYSVNKVSGNGTGNDYHLGSFEARGNGTANTVFPTIGFHQPGVYAASLQLRAGRDFRFYAQGGNSYASVTASAFNASGTVAGEGLAFNGKTAIGGSNDTTLRLNPYNQFTAGIYTSSRFSIGGSGELWVGNYSGDSTKGTRHSSAFFDGAWGAQGVSSIGVKVPDTTGAHWLITSDYAPNNIRSGIQVRSDTGGSMRLYTNRRSSWVESRSGNMFISGSQSSEVNSLTRKDYVDNTFVKKAGDNMTGQLNFVGGYIGSLKQDNRIMGLYGTSYSFVSSIADTHLCTNAYWDGTAWKKYHNTKPSGVLSMAPTEAGAQPMFKHSLAGGTDPFERSYRIYHEGFKPTWADVGGNDYFKVVGEDHIQAQGNWIRAALSKGFLPEGNGTGSASKSYLGTSTYWFKEAWVNQYRGGSVNVDGAGFFKGSVLSEYGGGGAVRLTGASGEGYLQGGLSDVAQVQRLNITGMSNSALTKCDIKMLGSNQPTVNGNAIYHAGNKPTADDVGLRLSTITKSLTLNNNWIDTGIEGSALASGSYMVQISGMNSSTGFYNEIFTGVMSWYDGSTNQQNSDEIILHAAGHARSDKTIYLRVLRQLSPNKLKLQISASHSLAASNYTFKFRRLI